MKTAASKAKGIVYEEEEENAELAPHDNGHAKWKMEFNTPGGVAPGIGIPQSQIMDTGTYYVCMYARDVPNMGERGGTHKRLCEEYCSINICS